MSPRPAPQLAAGPAVIVLIVGGTLLAVGGAMLVVAILGLIGDGEAFAEFAVPGLLLGGFGGLGAMLGSRRERSAPILKPYVFFLAVTSAWLAAATAGGIPLLLTGTFDSAVDAFFEAMSGFTTTGATVLPDFDQPDAVFWWRSMMQWLGGIGIVVLVVAIAPVSGAGLQRVFYAEVSGVTADRLTPRIIDTAKILAAIYLSLTAIALLAYTLAGMDVFDAANHTMTTVSTGGFSTESASIAAFDSVSIELVAIAGMILAGVNFAFYWRAVRGRDLMPQLSEVRAYLLILASAATAILASVLIADDVDGFFRAALDSSFSATTVMTGTGFTTADFDGWNSFARIGILVLMFSGACAGSTSGGIKVIRTMLLFKTARQEVRRQLQPTAVQVLKVGGRTFSEDVRRAVLGFALLYIIAYAIGSLAMAATGVDAITALSASATTINIVGPGLGDIGATDDFTAIPEAGRVVAALLMLTGRLEIFTVVALLAMVFRIHRRG